MSSIDLLKAERLNRLKLALKNKGDGFSSGLKRSFTLGDPSPTLLISSRMTPTESHLDPIIVSFFVFKVTLVKELDILDSFSAFNSPTFDPPYALDHLDDEEPSNRPPRFPLSCHKQAIEACQPDPAAILEKLEHLLSQLRQQVIPQDSQQAPPAEERSKLLRDFLDLSLEEITVACDHMEMVWTDDALADLCDCLESKENLGHAIARTVIQSFLYPHVIKLTTTLSRLLMNSMLQLGKRHGNALLNGLVFPLLAENNSLGRFQMELISKLATASFNVSSRTTLLRFLIAGSQETVLHLSDPSLQLLNTLASAAPHMDPATLRPLLQMTQQVVEARPKDKTCMQLLLTLTSKHASSLVDAKVLDDVEKVALQSDMFLKRAVLAQVTSIRKKAHEPI